MNYSFILKMLVLFSFSLLFIGCNNDFQTSEFAQSDLEKNNLKGQITAILEIEEFIGGDKIETLNIYNEKGMHLRELRHGMGMSDLVFYYDKSGRLTSQSGYSSRRIEYGYDGEGRLVKEISNPVESDYSPSGSFYITHTYEGKNLIRTKGEYNYHFVEPFTRDVQYFYDKAGRLFKLIEIDQEKEDSVETITLYNYKGLKVSATSEKSKTIFTYNEFGDLTAEEKFEVTDGSLSSAIYYKYSDRDHYGNYLIQEEIDNGLKIKVTRRVIYCPGDDFSEIVKRLEALIQLELTEL